MGLDPDRKLVLRHDKMEFGNGQTSLNTITAKVGKYVFSLSERYQKSTIKFSKRNFSNNASLHIDVTGTRTVSEQCSLGHTHETKKDSTAYHLFEIPWEFVDSFVDWFQLGDFTAVKGRKPRAEILLEETVKMIDQIKDPVFKEYSKKLKNKIHDYFNVNGYRPVEKIPKNLTDEGFEDARPNWKKGRKP